jgi:glycosyltransferase involved in cell wall biosynthesis
VPLVTGGRPLVTVIVPVYNEELYLAECLRSLRAQTYKPLEIIVVDDGSTDGTAALARRAGVLVLSQRHAGQARAVALAAEVAHGAVLAFLDGDQQFPPDFIERLVAPIVANECLGTSPSEEIVANPENVWSRCMQIIGGLPPEKRASLLPSQRAQGAAVYRAVRADAFRRVGGFDDVGYDDDRTLAAKLGQNARFVDGVFCYHHNPATLPEVFKLGSWGGKSVWHRRRWRGLLDFFPLRGVFRGLGRAVRHRFPPLAVYVPVLECGIFWGVAKRAFGLDSTFGA